jgi:hypothetical protein
VPTTAGRSFPEKAVGVNSGVHFGVYSPEPSVPFAFACWLCLLGIARSTLYRWLHKIEGQKPSGTPANKTPAEIASLVWEITKANLS